MPPYFMPPSTGQKMVPITLAAVGEHSLRLAGEVADGVRLHGFWTRRYMEEAIIPASRKAWPAPAAPESITGGGFAATGKDADATAKAFEIVRGRVAFYGSTPGYWGVLELHGLGDLGRELNAMSKAGKWNEMPSRVADDVVHLFAAVGTHKEIAGRIAERFGGTSDALNLRPDSSNAGGEVPPDVIMEIKRIATPFRGYRTAW
jgi:alkanesulfonate monooxygenase SsuD/methylene tetrahydromethanopterin reductase-like flavin-dependent oxidoreductase (luciferase family)